MLFYLQPKSLGGIRSSRTERRTLRANYQQSVLQYQGTEDNVALVKAVLKSDHRLNGRFIIEEVGLPKTRYPSNNYQI